jgi:hypothetical protein
MVRVTGYWNIEARPRGFISGCTGGRTQSIDWVFLDASDLFRNLRMNGGYVGKEMWGR